VAIGKRLRFEVLKRDGFKCKYCGANAAGTMLHVDHVIPVADGGSGDPENLVAARVACNAGKSSVRLDESRLSDPSPTEAMLEHAEQMREYLAAVQQKRDAMDAIVSECVFEWTEHINSNGMHKSIIAQLPYWVETLGLEGVLFAVRETSKCTGDARGQDKYFCAVMRNMRNRAAESNQ